jgi:hypothetical protein
LIVILRGFFVALRSIEFLLGISVYAVCSLN